MPIDLYASRPHYASHMLPIRAALPVDWRGKCTGPRPDDWWAVDPEPARFDAVMVASAADLAVVSGRARTIIYVEHGAGQTYPGDPRSADDPSYSGGAGHQPVALHIGPSETVAARWRDRYPDARAVAVGCPLLDPWHRGVRAFEGTDAPTVALTFHWDCALIPETRSAYRHYEAHIGRCVAAWRAQGFNVVGHGHPRVIGALTAVWAEHGVDTVNLGWVYDHADVFAGDNTSVLYEFASLGRDVVCMNAPWYRRDVNHGLRFWNCVPGVQVNDADHLIDTVGRLLTGDSATLAVSAMMRRGAVAHVYAAVDGYASWRAARAIMEVSGGAERSSRGRPVPEPVERGSAVSAA